MTMGAYQVHLNVVWDGKTPRKPNVLLKTEIWKCYLYIRLLEWAFTALKLIPLSFKVQSRFADEVKNALLKPRLLSIYEEEFLTFLALFWHALQEY